MHKSNNEVKKKPTSIESAGILFLLLFIIYGFSLSYPFHYDDWKVIVNNESIRYAGTLKNVLLSEASRPLTILSFAFNYRFSGTNPEYYRAVNIILHFLNSVFFYFIIKFFAEYSVIKIPKYSNVICAGIFLAHPLQTEAVTYISSRSELLVFFFCSASALSFLKSLKSENPLGWISSSVILFLFALVSKERAVMFPFIAAAFFFICKGNKKIIKGRFYYYLFSCLTADAVYIIYRFTFGASHEVRVAARTYAEQAAGALEAIRMYFRILFLPFNQSIEHTVNLPLQWRLAGDILILLLFLVSGILLGKKREQYEFALFGITVFLIPLIPNLLVPIEDLMTERWMYMSVAGLGFLILQLFVLSVKFSIRTEKLLIAPLIFFVVLSCARNSIWSDEISLWKDASIKSPLKARPKNNMAYVYIQRGDYNEAEKELSEALRLEPLYAPAYFNLGTLFSEIGKAEDAVEYYKKSFALDKGFKGAPVNIGVILARMKNDYSSAEEWFKHALSFDENFVPALENIAELYYVTQRYEKAAEIYRKLKLLGVRDEKLDVRMADSLRKTGFFAEALKIYSECIKDYGENTEALSGIGKINFSLGNTERALKVFERVIQIDSRESEAYGNIALILVKQGRSSDAIGYLDKLLELKPGDKRAETLRNTVVSGMISEKSAEK